MFPQELRYMPSHEWAKIDGDVCTVGISDFAVEQLTDIVFVELKAVGTALSAGKPIGEIESVKSVNDLYAPVDGEIMAVNDAVVKDPSLITAEPYGKGWLVKIKVKPGTTLDKLMTAAQYAKQVASQGH
jgi:glycine cleavage system H protein